MKDDETKVFASAKPVSPTDLAETETVGDIKAETREVAATTRTTPAKTTGVPAWHLSLTLGLIIALAGGILLWLQSPLLAVVVLGGLTVLTGLAVAVRHLVSRETRRSRTDAQSRPSTSRPSGSPAPSPRSETRNRPRSRKSHQHETSPETGRSQSRRNEPPGRDRTQDRSRRTETPRATRPRQTETTPSARPTAPRGTRTTQNTSGQTPPRVPPRHPQARGPRVPPRTTSAATQHTALGGPSGGIDPRPTRRPTDDRAVARDPESKPEPSNPAPLSTKPPKTEEKSDDRARSTPVTTKPSEGAMTPPTPEPLAKKPESTPDIAWPNVDLDRLPRVTIPRRAVKLPPVYHRNNEPQWPTDDPDRVVIPPQRDGRGTVATPDQLTSAQREQHYTLAATTATRLADEKNEQAYTFIAQAGDLDGVEGMEPVREGHLARAAEAARDAQVRNHLASIYAWLSQN